MNGPGKLIIIEGGDGSGKATQSERLTRRLLTEGFPALRITFPDYESASSALIKMYLGGEFGEDPEAVSPYVASTFYTVDRYASFCKAWGNAYKNGTCIIADRYTTSNLVHQGAKIADKDERYKYYRWLQEFEYQTFGLPKPDAVIFLDVPPSISKQLMMERASKMDGSDIKDIHERNMHHLENAHKTALELCGIEHWDRVGTVESGVLLGIEAIHERIWSVVKEIVGGTR